MLFNSIAFLIFLPIIIFLYWILPHRFRWIALLLASYYFYMSWNVNLIVLIGATTLISYGSGIIIEKSNSKNVKKIAVILTIISCLSILFFFKYFNFFSSSVTSMLRIFGLPVSDFSLNVMLPVGISFYTFQTLSYSIDVYKGKIKAEKHLGYYALFVSFFPQLVAGPIERPENLLPQLHEKHKINNADLIVGLRYMMIGFFKKVVIADTLSIIVNSVYNNASDANGITVMVATLLFAVQILCDFDGYTNIAIGAARMMGINLIKNFDHPYSALSIKDFWGRWHISLSTWLRDYVYIPLGGNRCCKFRHMFNIFLTFLLSGLWHGANWTFVIWGVLHGAYQIVGHLTLGPRNKLYDKIHINREAKWFKLIKQASTFCLVCFAWIFFRANSVSDALLLIGKIFTEWNFSLSFVADSFANMGITPLLFILIVLMTISLNKFHKMFLETTSSEYVMAFSDGHISRTVVRKVLYIALIVVVMLGWIYVVGQLGYENGFIYFQF